jgi:hypothetical protein
MMMKRLSFLVLPLAIFLSPMAAPQQSAQTIDRPAEPNLVFDDDGGKVQIVPADLSLGTDKKFHGGSVMASVRQISIFLGKGWGDAQVRARQAVLSDVTGQAASAHGAELRQRKVKTLGAAPSQEDFSDLGKAPVNDLVIQRKLADLLAGKAIPAPSANSVYVVFLAPGVSSTLGGNKAGVDYAAYHNFVNLEAGEVRYVVVPFHENTDKHSAAAARALAEAALNPNGQGWF